jgi:predicted house-cleaning noncanonical NTP pyrophosphatase (MazG superfamily)
MTLQKMRSFKQHKLWRDNLPAMMEKRGSVIYIKQLDDQEFDHELRLKLLEEADEVKAAQSDKMLIEELADLYEVIDSLLALHKIDKKEVLRVQERKRNERGGFMARAYVTVADHPEGSFGVEYCLAAPEKYPEIAYEDDVI